MDVDVHDGKIGDEVIIDADNHRTTRFMSASIDEKEHGITDRFKGSFYGRLDDAVREGSSNNLGITVYSNENGISYLENMKEVLEMLKGSASFVWLDIEGNHITADQAAQ